MPRDYKSRAAPRSRRRPKSPAWVWFIGGFLVGLFSAGLAWLKFSSPLSESGTVQTSTGPTVGQRDPRNAAAENGRPPPPRFDFYTLLPEMEVVIPEEELREPASAEAATGTQPAPAETMGREAYLLQMGSFRSHRDADRMKARLALLDIPADIQKVTINNKDTYHRVRSGPYQSRSRLNELRSRLQRNNIKSMVIRLNQGN